MKPSILFIGKKEDTYCDEAVEFVKLHFPERKILLEKRGDCFPEEIGLREGDYIISYLSPWIIPEYLIKRANKASINFHPGPLEYPGIGCTNFAIYNRDDTFGVTCHHIPSQDLAGVCKRMEIAKCLRDAVTPPSREQRKNHR